MSEAELRQEVELLSRIVARMAAEHDRVYRARWSDHKARKRRPGRGRR